MTQATVDQVRSEAFAGRMVELLNSAGLALMASVGHQVGLFDTLARLPPATVEQIADAAGLHQRYVREWLGAMVTGRVVEHRPGDATYVLPPEHAAWLTRAAGAGNLAVMAQFIPLLAQVEAAVVECFRSGGGVPYSAYPRLQAVMGEDTNAAQDATLLQAVLPRVDGLVERLRAGVDGADIGCGSGHAVNLLAQAFPNSRFVGYDLSEDGVRAGRDEARRLGLTNARFEAGDVLAHDLAGRFDLISSFNAIHDLARPDQALRAIAAALRPGGVFLMVDFAASSQLHENMSIPVGPFLYAASCMHCVPVTLAEGGAGLGAMWGEQRALRMLQEAGFDGVEVARVDGDAFNNYYIARR